MRTDLIQNVKKIYENDENIIKYLKTIENRDCNSIEDILISYDFQAGQYTKDYFKYKTEWEKLFKEREKIIYRYIEKNNYKDNLRILEAGVGEATAMYGFLNNINKILDVYGFDISWSRLKYADKFLKDMNFKHKTSLFTGDLCHIPIQNDSMDIVYTNHAIEPNGGREREILSELYRVTGSYLICFEPDYAHANTEARERMISHGYIKNLYETAIDLGYSVIEYEPLEYVYTEKNPASVIVIQKNDKNKKSNNIFADPIIKRELIKENNNYMYCEDSMCIYPIIDGIPCLLQDNSILATKYHEFN